MQGKIISDSRSKDDNKEAVYCSLCVLSLAVCLVAGQRDNGLLLLLELRCEPCDVTVSAMPMPIWTSLVVGQSGCTRTVVVGSVVQ
jgi:hypothetical protein